MTTLCLSHRKNEKCRLKEYVKVCPKKIQMKHRQMKTLLMDYIETFLIYIFLNVVNVVIFFSLKVHFTLKNLIFCMNFLINHMFRDIHRLVY
jgi:hypothetical protein